MQRIAIALATIFNFTNFLFAQSEDELARAARMFKASFTCAALASIGGLEEEFLRHFKAGIKEGKYFYNSGIAGKTEAAKNLPARDQLLSSTEYLSVDMLVGIAWSEYRSRTLNQVDAQIDKNNPLSTSETIEESRKGIALSTFRTSNCLLF